LGLSLVFRFSCIEIMVELSKQTELHTGPPIKDLIVDQIPFLPWVFTVNFVVWGAGVLPAAVYFVFKDPLGYARYSVTDGLLALTRGLCICVTWLGAVAVPTVVDDSAATNFLVRITRPITLLLEKSHPLQMNKDLFFSGHAATSFLLFLYAVRYPGLRWWMLVTHLLVVATVFLGHMHYTIDVVGAWAVTFSIYALREANVRSMFGLAGKPAGSQASVATIP
jgi:hypothetical protein